MNLRNGVQLKILSVSTFRQEKRQIMLRKIELKIVKLKFIR